MFFFKFFVSAHEPLFADWQDTNPQILAHAQKVCTRLCNNFIDGEPGYESIAISNLTLYPAARDDKKAARLRQL